MTLSRFDTDTAVERVDASTWSARIDRGWWIVNGPNGGYVAAILLRAMTDAVTDAGRTPRSLAIHFLRPPAEGSVSIEIREERRGRTLTTLTGRLLQGDRLMAVAIAAFATSRDGLAFTDIEAPDLPAPDTCPKLRDRLAGAVPMQHRYDSRLAIGEMFGAAPAAKLAGWIRLEEPRLADAPLIAAFTDAFPPAVFARASGREALGPVPTLDLTIHFRAALPLPTARPEDYYKVRFVSRASADGFVEEDGEVFSRDGVLLAQSRQLALVGL